MTTSQSELQLSTSFTSAGDRVTRAGLFALPAYGVLTFLAALNPQPDPTVDYDAWARFVTTPQYFLSHLLGSALGLILAVFGTFALGAYLTRGRSSRLGLTAMAITVLGDLLFLFMMALSTFAAPAGARAYLAGVRNIDQLQQDTLADTAGALIFVLVILLSFTGNVLLGLAIWRSAILPRVAGMLWIASAVALYALGLVIGALITHDSPPTEPIGALLVAISGTWIAWSARPHPVEVLR